MIVRPFRASDLPTMRLQKAQSYCGPYTTDEAVLADIAQCQAYTACTDQGEPIAVAGLLGIWENRAMAWAFLSEGAGPHMLAITRAVERFLSACAVRRVEAYVDVDFEAGHRWMATLGFSLEGTLRAVRPDGRDMVLYARVQHG